MPEKLYNSYFGDAILEGFKESSCKARKYVH